MGAHFHQKAAMAENGTTISHILIRFIFALKEVSPPPRMIPLSHAIWYAVPTVVIASTSMNCIERL